MFANRRRAQGFRFAYGSAPSLGNIKHRFRTWIGYCSPTNLLQERIGGFAAKVGTRRFAREQERGHTLTLRTLRGGVGGPTHNEPPQHVI